MDSEWLDIRIPDTLDCIRKLCWSEELKSIFNVMVSTVDRLADGEDLTISLKVLHEMNQLVPLTLASRAGNRPELIGAMTHGQFLTALKDCSNPNKPVNLDPRAV